MSPKPLTASTVLRRIPYLTVKVEAHEGVLIEWEGREMHAGQRALAVLDVFSQARSVSDGFALLKGLCKNGQEWIDATAAVQSLYEEGILIDELQPRLRPVSRRFDAAVLHVEMLNDRDRTARLLAAIAATVRPGDVVMDIGTGTGVLAMAAARAGASKVYAVEAGSMGAAARALFAANGMAERITLVEGWSTQVELAERADVLVSEILGNDVFGESVLEVVLDARTRLLKPEARMVPRWVKQWGVPVTVPEECLAKNAFTAAAAEKWQGWYGLEFAPLAAISREHPPNLNLSPKSVATFTALGDPVLLAEVDLTQFEGKKVGPRNWSAHVESEVMMTATRAGTVNGFLYYFDSELSEGNVLTTRPGIAADECSWRNILQVLKQPLEVAAGDRLQVKYQYRTNGGSFVTVERAGPQG